METAASLVYCNHCGFKSASDAAFCQRCGASLTAPAPSSPARVLRYAGFWIRLVAMFLDSVLIWIVQYALRMSYGSLVTAAGAAHDLPTMKILALRRSVAITIGILVAWLYRAGMESSQYQATFGKQAVGLKVTDLLGQRMSFPHATTRYLCRFVAGIFTLGIGYIMAGFSPNKQGLHDRLAGTLVVYK